MTLIEIFGAPGSGKTTLAQAMGSAGYDIDRKTLAASWNALSRPRRLAHLTRSFLNLRTVMQATRLAIAAPLASSESLFRAMRLIAKSDWLRKQSGVVLLDQGLLQELWSVLYSAQCNEVDSALLVPLLGSLYEKIEARIVFIDVDCATLAARIAGRDHGHSRLDRLAGPALARSLVRTESLVRAVVEAARMAGLHVDTLNGSVAVERLADQLSSIHLRRTRL